MTIRLHDVLSRRVLVLDGAMGTTVHTLPLDVATDYLGCENCTDVLSLSRPDVIEQIHDHFLASGADAVETNTFGASVITLDEFELGHRARELNRQAAEVARAACDRHATAERPRFVLGSIGPGTRLLTLGQTDWSAMHASYREQVRGLLDGGVDALLVETCQDLLQVKCAIDACLSGLDERGLDPERVPIMVQVTIETSGTMLLGTEIAAVATALARSPIFSLGLNCATGPAEMTEHVRWLARHWSRPISIVPNAGLPVLVEGHARFPLGPDPFAEKMLEFVETLGVAIVGGCCGTTPEHIRRLAAAVGGRAPARRDVEAAPAGCTSLFSPVEYRQDTSILNVGERTNASGSRLFKRLLEDEDWDGVTSLAREMVREGSHVIDVNVDYAGRDNPRDMAEIVGRLVRQVNAPLMLDSTQPETIEAGLRRAGGKCIINSANLEDGETRFAEMCGLARTYGAGLVLGCIDDDPQEAMARTAERKEAVAARLHALAVGHGLASEDLLFDPLVLPVTTGMEKDRRSALETIEGVRRIAARFPASQIVVGLSNVSFGLRPAARQVLNSVFLAELVEAGLTSAILHVSKILPRTRIDDAQWQAALDLIHDRRPAEPVALADGTRTDDPLQIFIDLFPADAAPAAETPLAERPLEERLRHHVLDGERRGLADALDEALARWSPLEIINDHLLDGMREVGEMFASGRMQLPFVLQSAEIMKAAVAHLEPHMDKVDGAARGSIVLATVRGDVHDIGKNLVDILLTNNGYRVHNIGIKQPPSAVIAAWREHRADAIGLSGLLVKSVNVMEETLREFNEQGIEVPVLLGGAALARQYCEDHLRPIYRGRVYYGKDAFEGLRIMEHLEQGRLEALDAEIVDRAERREAALERTREVRAKACGGGVAVAAPATRGRTEVAVPRAPFLGARLVEHVPLEQVYPYVNTVALFRGQWQFRKGKLDDAAYRRLLEDEAEPVLRRLREQCEGESILRPAVVYGWFPCLADGDDLIVLDPDDPERERERFTFPRQKGRDRRCISDHFRDVESHRRTGERDVIGLQCVTVGAEASARARTLFERGDYAEYLFLHGFGVECAEALAELWHKRMRVELGIGNDDAPDVRGLFTQGYRGSRYSFGYPACPDMSDQAKLFRLLHPERIGCTLTESWQIDPEQSTSAIVVHHPDARYFAV